MLADSIDKEGYRQYLHCNTYQPQGIKGKEGKMIMQGAHEHYTIFFALKAFGAPVEIRQGANHIFFTKDDIIMTDEIITSKNTNSFDTVYTWKKKARVNEIEG